MEFKKGKAIKVLKGLLKRRTEYSIVVASDEIKIKIIKKPLDK